MSLKHSNTPFEVRSVDTEQRIIAGYANVFGVVDTYGTRWTQKTFERTLIEDATKVRVFIGHDVRQLPVGVPVTFRIDEHGLYTETLVAPTQAGDDLLASARFWQQQGSPLGMSVGFRPVRSHFDGDVEVFDDVDLREYSFLAPDYQSVPGSAVTGVRVDGEPSDPHVILAMARDALDDAISEIADRVSAARVLGDPVQERALSEEHHDVLRGVIARIRGVLDPTPTDEPIDEPPPDEDERSEVDRFLDELASRKESTSA